MRAQNWAVYEPRRVGDSADARIITSEKCWIVRTASVRRCRPGDPPQAVSLGHIPRKPRRSRTGVGCDDRRGRVGAPGGRRLAGERTVGSMVRGRVAGVGTDDSSSDPLGLDLLSATWARRRPCCGYDPNTGGRRRHSTGTATPYPDATQRPRSRLGGSSAERAEPIGSRSHRGVPLAARPSHSSAQ